MKTKFLRKIITAVDELCAQHGVEVAASLYRKDYLFIERTVVPGGYYYRPSTLGRDISQPLSRQAIHATHEAGHLLDFIDNPYTKETLTVFEGQDGLNYFINIEIFSREVQAWHRGEEFLRERGLLEDWFRRPYQFRRRLELRRYAAGYLNGVSRLKRKQHRNYKRFSVDKKMV